jgi:pSer/pThr/pTyr-binding forkhead associated (FHA) protein
MDLKLKVLDGKNAGQAIPVSGKKFFIGRAEDCHLRPNSDLISRHHCVLLVEEGYIGLRDFGSKNGTFVNDDRIIGERELKPGDRLTIGPLHFEVHIAHEIGGKKRPPVSDVKEAASRTAQDAAKDTFDVAEWLSNEQEATSGSTVASDTQRLSMTETDSIAMNAASAAAEEPPADEPAAEPAAKGKPAKRTPGKLPPSASSTKDSQEAAAAMLSKLRRRR